MKYQIAVVGPIPRDTILTHRGERIEKYGCVTHPTIALAKLLEGAGTVIPIAHVHEMDYEPIIELFKPYSNIDISGISSAKNSGTIIELEFIDQNNRLEKQIANMEPIKPQDVEAFLGVDCFVFVPITDFEIELQTLKYIREHSEAKIIFDAHGPTSFVDRHGNRLRRYWRDKEQWLPYIDVLKMNLEESLCCWYDRNYSAQEELFDEENTSHLDAFADFVLDRGVQTLYVTLDSRGCVIYQNRFGEISKDFIHSVKVEEVIDTTGCGDSFAGGLAYGFTVHENAKKAAQYANALGALRTQGKGFEVFKSLQETDALIRQHYS